MVMLRYEIVSIIHKLGVVTKWPLGNVEFKILDLILNELSESQSEYIFGVTVVLECCVSMFEAFWVVLRLKHTQNFAFPQGHFLKASNLSMTLAFGVGWGNNVHVHLHTMVMLRYEIVPSIWGGVG